jgi:hypothetical protein
LRKLLLEHRLALVQPAEPVDLLLVLPPHRHLLGRRLVVL